MPEPKRTAFASDPLWYKDAIIYELHVRAFHDSNGDGIGDFAGLIDKLDYLQDLGVTALWLLPFYPSPLRDDGYDIADYANIHPAYGTMHDFRAFLHEAHRRGLRVITELVINHTSSDHPWFQRARRSPVGSTWRDFYVWSDSAERYHDARIIFQDFERSNWTWDPIAHAYYWHRFYSHQPDLNFENPAVRQAVFDTVDLWMDMGVDGLRLDAIPYLFEREGTNCENLPETHAFLRELRSYVDARYRDRLLLAEANQWPEDAATYFGKGDECHMNFHFPVMPRMFMAVQLENRFPIVDILDQTPEVPENCQWAVFLRNHDELTLEMVTDEDRDYMYRMYASDPKARVNLGIRRRLAPLLKVRRKVELLNGLLFSLPGTPVLYYGDEIGMGDNIYLGDRDGVRTPMQWSADRNAGFSRANPQKLYLPIVIDSEHHFEAVNVEAQQENTNSLLWWTKRLIAHRKQFKVFGRGSLEFLHPANHKVLAFIRECEDERILAVFNLSRFAQYVELDLSRFRGNLPFEVWGSTQFPRIGEMPYLLTLGPYDFYWFELRPGEDESVRIPIERPTVRVVDSHRRLWQPRLHPAFGQALIAYLREHPWFHGQNKAVREIKRKDVLRGPDGSDASVWLVVEVEYVDGENESYVLPVAFAEGTHATDLEHEHASAIIVHVVIESDDGHEERRGVLYEPISTGALAAWLLRSLAHADGLADDRLQWWITPELTALLTLPEEDRRPRPIEVDQANTSIAFGEHAIVKMFRRVEVGESLDVEVPRFLTERAGFAFTPPVIGGIEYEDHRGARMRLAMVQRFVPHQGDAWKLALDELDRYFDRALSIHEDGFPVLQRSRSLFTRANDVLPDHVVRLIGPFVSFARLLGLRTGQLHAALLSEHDDPAFVPEPFSSLYQRSIYQAGRAMLRQNVGALKNALPELDPEVRPLAEQVIASESVLDAKLRRVIGPKIDTVRIRCHGHFHLGQVLYTGKDFYFIDFEGETGRSLTERRLKRSPLRDVVSMIRSFYAAAHAALRLGRLRPEDIADLQPWAELWAEWASAIYLRAFTEVVEPTGVLPPRRDREILLDFFLIEKCVYELRDQLDNHRDRIGVSLRGLAALADSPAHD